MFAFRLSRSCYSHALHVMLTVWASSYCFGTNSYSRWRGLIKNAKHELFVDDDMDKDILVRVVDFEVGHNGTS